MSLVSATRSTQLLNYTSAIVLELQEKTIQYSHQSRLQTGELHELLRKSMNIHHVLQTCTMITGGGGIPPLPAHAQTVDTRPYLFSSIGLGTRLVVMAITETLDPALIRPGQFIHVLETLFTQFLSCICMILLRFCIAA